jgi:hypothetical protein
MRIPKKLFMTLVPISVWASRNPARAPLARWLMRMFGSITMWLMQAKPQEQLEDIGLEWQRMFPSNKDVPITGIENDTIRAEIHIHCPHRGTGNVEGCYRMMEYDRKMLEKIGGQLVVLRSQAEPGVKVCKLAIRKEGAPINDLIPATARARSD